MFDLSHYDKAEGHNNGDIVLDPTNQSLTLDMTPPREPRPLDANKNIADAPDADPRREEKDAQ